MAIQLNEENGGKLLAVGVSGKLAKADYEHFVPEFERLVQQHGKLSVLFDMTDFHGWDAGALWEDTKFAVAGHLTIFLTRTRGPFWSIRPARILWVAVLGTQSVATLIAVYGLFMTPLGWGWALFVWGYALAWFLLNDRVKLLAYRVFDPTAAPLLAKKPAPA